MTEEQTPAPVPSNGKAPTATKTPRKAKKKAKAKAQANDKPVRQLPPVNKPPEKSPEELLTEAKIKVAQAQRARLEQADAALVALCNKYRVDIIAKPAIDADGRIIATVGIRDREK